MKNNFPNFKQSELSYYVWRNQPYFAFSTIIEGQNNIKTITKYLGLKTGIGMLQINGDFYCIKKDLGKFTAEFERKIKSANKSYGPSVVKKCFSRGEHLVATSRKIYSLTKNKHLTEKQLIANIRTFYQEAKTYCAFYLVAWFDAPGKALAEKLAKKYSSTQAEEKHLFELITSPSQETAAEHEQLDFLELCSKNFSGKVLQKQTAKHAQTYGWLGVRYFLGKPWSTEDILSRVKQQKAQTAQKQLAELLEHKSKIKEAIHKLNKKLTPEERTTVAYIRDVVFLRTQRANYFHLASYYLLPLIGQVAQKLNLKPEEVLSFTPMEVCSALKLKKNLKLHALNRAHSLVTVIKEASQCLEGKEAFTYIRKHPFLLRKAKPVSTLVGTPAYGGKIVGITKIVKSSRDTNKVNPGDILVTNMTIPPFIAAMERAGAFVTDEGGILCHAAIIAREMNKPCIIGTKIATKVFKDGDMVEVDANKGIVRKL